MSAAAERYDTALRRGRYDQLPAGTPIPQPTAAWPAENVALLERYQAKLMAGGLSHNCIQQLYIPMAGHVLGLNLKPHPQLDLESDLERAMDFIRAKQLSQVWTRNCRHALNRFRRFLLQERGQLVEVTLGYPNLDHYQQGLPDWLVEQLTRYQHLRQVNWRPARLNDTIRRFWSSHSRVWRWLVERCGVSVLGETKRQHLFDYIDHRLAAGYAPSGINHDLHAFQAFLHYLQEQDHPVPQALLRLPFLKQPDRLPRFLTDEQVELLRQELERQLQAASTLHQRRIANLDRAAFYLLWQGGLRLGEAEELRLDDLELPHRRLTVREGKGKKDRTVFLTQSTVQAVESYLTLRGPAQTDHLLIYRTRPLCKDLIRDRLRAGGKRVGVKVSPHRLRHTYATQLVNAGCRITSIQQLMGHRRLNTTLIYARVHDHTVAEDYYAAMEIIEERQLCAGMIGDLITDQVGVDLPRKGDVGQILTIVDSLGDGNLDRAQRETVRALRASVLAFDQLNRGLDRFN